MAAEAIACEGLSSLNNTVGGFIEYRRMRFDLVRNDGGAGHSAIVRLADIQ